MLREAVDLAYSRDLAIELGKVEEDFRKWRVGEIDEFELTENIHKYHNGPAKDLFGKYVGNPFIDNLTASALIDGLISSDEVPAELVEFLRPCVERVREVRERHDRDFAEL